MHQSSSEEKEGFKKVLFGGGNRRWAAFRRGGGGFLRTMDVLKEFDPLPPTLSVCLPEFSVTKTGTQNRPFRQNSVYYRGMKNQPNVFLHKVFHIPR